jgi:hypothetical protein
MKAALKKIWDWLGSVQGWWVNFYLHGFLIVAKVTGFHSEINAVWVNVFFFLLSIFYIWKKTPIK